ncbi:MAG: hypothetical protein KKH91_03860 [Elusimicrobia bacterium]|nr:hypothetical protein [Elusimicrobiota bacterium]MBU2614214.1 hypothetical protein [Elusimicrobiota bacterium]
MEDSVLAQIAELENMSIKQLKEKCVELYGNEVIPQDNILQTKYLIPC